MGHSHLVIQHLLKKLETDGPRPRRDRRPDWVTDLINHAAELFEPFTEIGRVGFDCRFREGAWEIALYLGSAELIGGKDDGHVQVVDFQFDLARLVELIQPVEKFVWNAIPARPGIDGPPDRSLIAIQGLHDGNRVHLHVYGTPPDEAGPGLRFFEDGRWETT